MTNSNKKNLKKKVESGGNVEYCCKSSWISGAGEEMKPPDLQPAPTDE